MAEALRSQSVSDGVKTIDDFKTRTDEVITWLKDELAKVRTSRATPAFLDPVMVEAYGVKNPINQVASISVSDAKTLRISPWDKGLIKSVEGAIERADLGVSISSDDTGVRVSFPELTAEKREQIAKAAKAKHEEARVTLRHERDEARKKLQASEKSGEISEDELTRHLEAVEKVVTDTNDKLDEVYNKKHQELTSI